MKRLLFSSFFLFVFSSYAQHSLQLVKDITPGEVVVSSNPNQFIGAEETIFFVAEDELNGEELWKSDGTKAGTELVKDIYLGSFGSSIESFMNVNNLVYFIARDRVNGTELWRTDGTNLGTFVLRDFVPGFSSGNIGNFIVFNDTLHFTASDGVGFNLWKTDGTVAGTVIVDSLGEHISDIVVSDNYIFYIKNRALWRTDGSSSGSVLLKSFFRVERDVPLTAIQDTVYFLADDGSTGYELWKSDGTVSGTNLLKDITAGSSASEIERLTKFRNELYFSLDDGVNGRELWKSDGSSSGTALFKDLDSSFQFGTASSGDPQDFFIVNDLLYFMASDSASGRELWKTDGTAIGTELVKDIYEGTSSSRVEQLIIFNDTLYFTADDDIHGRELWKSDGTEAGTQMVKDIDKTPKPQNPKTPRLRNKFEYNN